MQSEQLTGAQHGVYCAPALISPSVQTECARIMHIGTDPGKSSVAGGADVSTRKCPSGGLICKFNLNLPLSSGCWYCLEGVWAPCSTLNFFHHSLDSNQIRCFLPFEWDTRQTGQKRNDGIIKFLLLESVDKTKEKNIVSLKDIWALHTGSLPHWQKFQTEKSLVSVSSPRECHNESCHAVSCHSIVSCVLWVTQ